MLRCPGVVLLAALCIAAPALSQPAPTLRPLLVAAAASLGVVEAELAKATATELGVAVRFNFAGSNTLARQIIEGAPVDVFLSADALQMDLVERADRLEPGTRLDLLGNQLVVITRSATAVPIRGAPDLAASTIRRLAIGEPNAVPAGVYTRQWLQRAAVWTSVVKRVVPLPSSPAVVAAVREGRVDAGVVYVTDVTAGGGVSVAYRVPLNDAPTIVYPAAAMRRSRTDTAREFLAWLQQSTARQIFERAGFRVIAAPADRVAAHAVVPGGGMDD